MVCRERCESNRDTKKSVRFSPQTSVIVLHAWMYAYKQARKGQWEQYARDAIRFKQRIKVVGEILSSILSKEHQEKMRQKIIFYEGTSNFV